MNGLDFQLLTLPYLFPSFLVWALVAMVLGGTAVDMCELTAVEGTLGPRTYLISCHSSPLVDWVLVGFVAEDCYLHFRVACCQHFLTALLCPFHHPA